MKKFRVPLVVTLFSDFVACIFSILEISFVLNL